MNVHKSKFYLLVKAFIICLFLLVISITTHAQDNKNMIGLRGQINFSTITVKRFLNESRAVEVLVHPFSSNSFVVEPIYEIYFPIGEDGLHWFVGPGASLKFTPTNIVIGALAIVGMDYTFEGVPINLSIDWKPSFEVINGSNTYLNGFGLGARFVF